MLLAALAAAVVAAVVALSSNSLTIEGVAAVTAAAAFFTATIIFAASEPRGARAGWVVASIISLLLGVVGAVALAKHAPPGVAEFVGGCAPFEVSAQNRWAPFGAVIRKKPYPDADTVRGVQGSQRILVDGWVRTKAPYPQNDVPWDSDAWFHLADNSGWVAFAAVRAESVPPDLTGLDRNGGRPAPRDPACGGSVRP